MLKVFKNIGSLIPKDEMKKILGGRVPVTGCTARCQAYHLNGEPWGNPYVVPVVSCPPPGGWGGCEPGDTLLGCSCLTVYF